MQELRIFVLPLMTGKEYFQILLKPDGDQHDFVPGIKLKDSELSEIPEDRLNYISNYIKWNYGLYTTVISLEPIVIDEPRSNVKHLYYGVFISRKRKDGTVFENSKYKWTHPRFAYSLFKKLSSEDILENVLEWASSHDYAIEMLSNNLEKIQ